jgi:nitroimidazol reductase NimA-like FMN-containing flavoprotein (pyridoxamine 5'-phosphate oxidase superfamily)
MSQEPTGRDPMPHTQASHGPPGDGEPAPNPREELRVRRLPERASYDRESASAIIDAALIAHVGTMRDGLPIVIPMLAVRDGDWLLLHGAPAGGTFRRGRGQPVCATMTILDGLVLARSAFHHSLNYRSVVVLGEAELIADESERERALDLFVDRLVPGRRAQLRPMTRAELRQTAVLRIALERSSTKVRTGPPKDDEEDADWPVWAGVVPVTTGFGTPEADPALRPGIELPEHIDALIRPDR